MVSANRKKLSETIEIDECYIGAEAVGKYGRSADNKVLVIVGTELDGKKLGRIRMSVIENAGGNELHKFIEENVEQSSTVITDAWNGYNGIENKGYTRIIYNQKKAKIEEEMLPHVHLIISLLKRWLLGTHQGAVEKKHLQAYLDEYVFRFNRRKSSKRCLLFYRLLENAMVTPPKIYTEIIGKSQP